ncbi:MAG: metal-sensing transcriptional repressor [Clostridia bacterium]|nr:metal-sensing transcriptional repressor [Clostridia bacterium]
MEHTCCERKTIRTEDDKKRLINRLSRMEGQLRGIRAMVEADAYCADVLTQAAAVRAAIDAFDRELLGMHVRSCVSDDIRAGDERSERAVDELLDLMRKLM